MKEYDVFTALINNSGFGWNDNAKLPTAPDHVWDTYLRAHKEATKFRHATLQDYEQLRELLAFGMQNRG